VLRRSLISMAIATTGVVALSCLGPLAPPSVSASDWEPRGAWVDVGPMPNRRAGPMVVRLKDGRVLVAGGETTSDGRCKSNADIFDPDTNSWSRAAAMHRDRCAAEGVLLRNGTVLVVGGVGLVDGMSHYWRLTEIYHPATDRWSKAAHLNHKRASPIVERIGKHRVLVAGGNSHLRQLTTAEIYNLRSRSWRDTESMSVARFTGQSARLGRDRVLVTGGRADDNGRRHAEIYSLRRGGWHDAGAHRGGKTPTLFRLPSGDVLAIDGAKTRRVNTIVHRYDVRTHDWSRDSTLPVSRHDPEAVSLRGMPFLLGGWCSSDTYTSRTALLWRPRAESWVHWTRLPQPLGGHAAVRLSDGSILVLGGQTELTEGTHVPRKLAYRYYP
jgi:hypothetical protein